MEGSAIKKFKEICMKAYGLTRSIPDKKAIEMIQPFDPISALRRLGEKVKLPKTAIYHGAKDTNIPASTSAIPLAEVLRKAGGEVELLMFSEREHDIYAMGEQMERLLGKFFSALLGII